MAQYSFHPHGHYMLPYIQCYSHCTKLFHAVLKVCAVQYHANIPYIMFNCTPFDTNIYLICTCRISSAKQTSSECMPCLMYLWLSCGRNQASRTLALHVSHIRHVTDIGALYWIMTRFLRRIYNIAKLLGCLSFIRFQVGSRILVWYQFWGAQVIRLGIWNHCGTVCVHMYVTMYNMYVCTVCGIYWSMVFVCTWMLLAVVIIILF